MLLGQFVHTEMHTAKGRVDCIVEADDYIYIFEFKRDADEDTALSKVYPMSKTNLQNRTVIYSASQFRYKLGYVFNHASMLKHIS